MRIFILDDPPVIEMDSSEDSFHHIMISFGSTGHADVVFGGPFAAFS